MKFAPKSFYHLIAGICLTAAFGAALYKYLISNDWWPLFVMGIILFLFWANEPI